MGRDSLLVFAAVSIIASLWRIKAREQSQTSAPSGNAKIVTSPGSLPPLVTKLSDSGEIGSASETANDKDFPMKDSVIPYDRHVIVFGAGSNESWPEKMEDATCTSPSAMANSQSITTELIRLVQARTGKEKGGEGEGKGKGKGKVTVESLSPASKSAKPTAGISAKKDTSRDGLNVNVVVTCSSEPSNGELGYYQAIMYPEELIFQIAPSNLERFVELCCNPRRNVTDNIDTRIFKIEPVPWKHLILVCTHVQRDKRCGRAGPQIIGKITTALQEGHVGSLSGVDIKVVDTSHIGGHKFAGTMIVYPIAHWYGQVSAKGNSVDKILAEINGDGCHGDCHRGTGKLLGW